MADSTKKLIMESDPAYIDFGLFAPRGIDKFVIVDSIFGFFPYIEMHLLDGMGYMADTLPMIDNMKFFTVLKDLENKKELKNTYALTTYQLQGRTSAEYLSGVSILGFIDSNHLRNLPVSKIFKDRNMKSAIEELIKVYELNGKFISDNIRNKGDWKCFNYIPSEYLQLLSEKAVARDNPKFPYYCFSNAKKEFYFMNILELMNQQPVHTFDMAFSKDQLINDKKIQSYIFIQNGALDNFYTFHQKGFYVNEKGDFSNSEEKITDHIPKTGSKNILNIFKTDLDPIRTYDDLGIQDKESYTGLRNADARDAVLNNRMYIVCHYNPDLVSGKTVNVKVGSYEEGQGKNNFVVSGKYVILESRHSYANHRGTNVDLPMTQILIGKPTINISDKNRLYPDLVKI